MSAVHDAAIRGDVEGLRVALSGAGPDAHAPNADGWTPLHLAAYYGHAAAVVVLLGAGADPRARSTNSMANTALHAAIAGEGVPLVVVALIDGGANPHEVAAGSTTALHLAAARGNRQLVDLLLQHGADPRARLEDGSMPHHVAAGRGHEALALWLEGQAAP
jgi:ankyrin repeat protein